MIDANPFDRRRCADYAWENTVSMPVIGATVEITVEKRAFIHVTLCKMRNSVGETLYSLCDLHFY